MILKQIDGAEIDLSQYPRFVEHYAKPNSFAKEILEECNSGQWYHECLEGLPNDSIIIDAGANVGLWGTWIAPKAKRVYGIEPSYSHFTILQEISAATNFIILGCPCALWNKNGNFDIEQTEENTTENHITEKAGQVHCETLAEFMACESAKHWDEIHLLKLDIEGAEQQVILEDPTSGEALKRCGIVYVEVHPPPYGNADEQGIIEKMKSLGFTHHAGRRGLAHFFVNGN